MKDITIGKLKYKRIETLFDINDERFNVFKQYLLQTFEGLDKPVFSATYSKVVGYFDKGQYADAMIELHNFKKAIELTEMNYDATSFCFALLTLSPDENQNDISSDFQESKLNAMRKAGLNRGEVEETVINFIEAHQEQFAVYIQMLEIMRLPRKGELSKESSD